jgi:hypothetical protein
MKSTSADLRFAAVFEAAKGILVFATTSRLSNSIDVQEAAEQLVSRFPLNPASR